MSEEPTIDDGVAYAWRMGYLEFKLWRQQKPIYNAIRSLPRHTEPIVILCARQFGKSVLGTLMAVEDCLRNPEVAVLIVGPTIQQTVAIVNQSMQVLQRDAPEGLIRRAKAESQWYVGQSELIIGGFDVHTATRKRGRRLHRIYLEELVDSHPDDYREALQSDLGPALTHSDDASMVFLTTLPRIPDHPFITETIPKAKLKNAFYNYTIDDNIALSPEQYEACVDRCGGRNTIAFKREYLNEIVRDPTVVVIPTFDRRAHVKIFAKPLEIKWNVVIDWGGVRDKTVALLMYYDFLSDLDMVWDELVFNPNTPTSEIVAALMIWDKEFKPERRIADVAGQIAVDLNQTYNYTIIAPEKSDWQSSVNQMVARFAQNKVILHPRCRFTATTCESGVLNKNKTDFDRSEALGHCDALAALMYGLRCIDRTNPYGMIRPHRDTFFVYKEPAIEDKEVAESIVQRSFVQGAKKFGSFK